MLALNRIDVLNFEELGLTTSVYDEINCEYFDLKHLKKCCWNCVILF